MTVAIHTDKLTKDYEGKINTALEKKTKEITEV